MSDESTSRDASRADSVEAFAADLRRLRLESDSPTLNRLAHHSGVSRSVLSDAFAGRTLPSARTVAGIVRACAADPGPWIARRDALADARRSDAVAPAPVGAGDDAGDRPAPRRLRPRWLWPAAAFVAGIVVGALVVIPFTSRQTPAAADAAPASIPPLIQVATGEDPGRTECIRDADVVTSVTGPDNALLEIVWSDACQAGWARTTRYDGLEAGNTVTARIYPQTSPDGDLTQQATEHDVNSGYTFLIVRPTPDTLLCATGSFTVAGTSYDIPQICT